MVNTGLRRGRLRLRWAKTRNEWRAKLKRALPDFPAGGRGGQRQQLPDAQLVRRARVGAGSPHAAGGRALVGARRAAADGLPAGLQPAHVRADQRHLLRRGAQDDVGRVEQSWGGLRDSVVIADC